MVVMTHKQAAAVSHALSNLCVCGAVRALIFMPSLPPLIHLCSSGGEECGMLISNVKGPFLLSPFM